MKALNILYLSSDFPKPSQGDSIYTDLLTQLSLSNCIVKVAVFYNGTETEKNVERGFEVLRIAVGKYYECSLIKKAFTMLSIPKKVKNAIKAHFKDENFDLILFESPPLTMFSAVKWAMKYYCCGSYLMQKDIFPQNAKDIGLMNGFNPIYRYFRRREKKMLKKVTYIGAMSEGNKNYLLEHNRFLNKEKIDIFPNTLIIKENTINNRNYLKTHFAITNEQVVFIFGGNMGRPQYVEILCKAIRHFKYDNNKYFIFVGRGTERYKIEQTISSEEINNAKLLEKIPRKDFEELLSGCDVGLITLDPRFTIPNYPSRILSYMEKAKPVIAATDGNTDFRNLIVDDAKCGLWSLSSEHKEFFRNIEIIAESKELRDQYGQNGRKFFEENFNVEQSIRILKKRFGAKDV
ncbi:MAG: glycosyltransferase family 4 protein [Erysipelotrichales bacterium]|nr:glycosyltransferase family 4 protein [Erysipelotrichales bacterium]